MRGGAYDEDGVPYEQWLVTTPPEVYHTDEDC